MIDALIFSKNRPMQLNCLLSSLKENSNLQQENITVLYRYDNEFLQGLEIVKKIHPNVNFIKEENFEQQVKAYLKLGQKLCVFFVDDIIIKDSIDFEIPRIVLEDNPSILCFSLRLGTHLTQCYPNASKQAVPNGAVNSQLFAWGWRGGQHDWGYPFSVDGHVFRRSELEGWSSHLHFNNPNQFESVLQTIPHTFSIPQGMVCHLNSKLFNNPINRVQNEFNNRAESLHTAADFNDAWMSGMEIDYTIFKNFLNYAAHTPVSFKMRKRQ